MERIANLDTLSFVSRQEVSTCIVLFHGYGANAYDLASLRTVLNLEDKFDWFFPQGFLDVDRGMGLTGKAWYPVSFSDLDEVSRFKQSAQQLKLPRPLGLDRARKMALECVKKLESSYQKIIIGGFSQGAILTVDLAASFGEKIDKLVLLSGVCVDKEELQPRLSSVTPVSFFQSHGTQDPILPFDLGRQLYELLQSCGHKGVFCSFEGGHEIPNNILKKLREFLLD